MKYETFSFYWLLTYTEDLTNKWQQSYLCFITLLTKNGKEEKIQGPFLPLQEVKNGSLKLSMVITENISTGIFANILECLKTFDELISLIESDEEMVLHRIKD